MFCRKNVNYKVVVIMANDKLCFVLGAGASSHFGYPLGNELVEAMENLIEIAQKQAMTQDIHNAMDFIKDIKSYNPLNIDYYLHNHPEKEQIAKKLIEATILYSQGIEAFEKNGDLAKWWKNSSKYDGEKGFSERHKDRLEPRFNKNYFPPSNWVKFIHHRIVANCKETDKVKEELNNLSIVTFNYDLSFEQALWRYFKTSKFTEIRDYLFNTFFKKNIVHVYGKVVRRDANGNPIEENYECKKFDIQKSSVSQIFRHSNGDEIKIIGVGKSEEKNENAVRLLEQAKKIYFLGYAFDNFNNQVIGLGSKNSILKKEEVYFNKCFSNSANKKAHLDTLLEKEYKEIFYTNMDDGFICDSKVRSFTGGKPQPFTADGRLTHIRYHNPNYYANGYPELVKTYQVIKSTKKNVYGALEKDLPIPLSES